MIHLTRKWRPKSFNEIVGQRLTVRLLKNSLYKDHVFPVYLFSGVRGSGKTSMGRIFAAALNCSCLKNFQENPKDTVIPCVDQCDSCRAMLEGNHPDFIEIDAASHTGVDHVRHIIETASFLPTLGSKKVYLIDEAHMLSKAAFNAFLKILEEPPATVVFLLATTDPHKILPTVRSRCFQLFFDALSVTDIVGHLEHICKEESIAYESQGLALIAQETDGCVRDAMNLLERVRFSSGGVSCQTVMQILGDLSDQVLVQIFTFVVQGESDWLMKELQRLADKNFSPVRFWNKMVGMLRSWLYRLYGAPISGQDFSEMNSLDNISVKPELLIRFLEYLYACEASFLKTTQQRVMVEMVLIKFVQWAQKYNQSGQSRQGPPPVKKAVEQKSSVVVQKKTEAKPVLNNSKPVLAEGGDSRWNTFLQACTETVQDRLILTVFQQGHFIGCDTKGVVEVHFPKKFAFYKDLIQAQQETWLPCMEKAFEVGVTFVPKFILDSESAKKEAQRNTAQKLERSAVEKSNSASSAGREQEKKVSKKKAPWSNVSAKRTVASARETVIDVADQKEWPETHALLRVFPGRVVQVQEGSL